MSLKDGIVFWTFISNYETKARVSFYRCLWNTYEETLGSKSILRTFEHYQLTLITGVPSAFLAATFFITELSLTPWQITTETEGIERCLKPLEYS